MRAGAVIAGLCAAIVIGNAPAIIIEETSPVAQAVPFHCEHRGFKHIERHGGKLEDDRWHRAHGQPVTCDHDSDDGKGDDRPSHDEPLRPVERRHDNRDDDKHRIKHRDKPGFHCRFVVLCG